MADNGDLAANARQLADAAANGSEARKAYGCAAIALTATRSVAAARRVLASECPAGIRQAALAALGELADAGG